jgi:Na+/phosphate symporter
MADEIEVKLAMLERDFVGLKDVVEKLEHSIDKLTSISSCMERIVAVHENVNENQKEVNDVLFDKLEQERENNRREHHELSDKLLEVSKSLKEDISELKKADSDRIQKLEEKVSTIEKWRWMVIGGGAVVGASFSVVFKFISKLLE